MPRRLAPAAVSFVLLVGLLVYLFWVPLRPAAWGGPRGKGPFEEDDPPAAGRWARDVRLPLERFATWRSPGEPLAATGEALLGFHAVLAASRFAILWVVLRRLGGRGWLATLGVLAAALPTVCGGPRQDEWDVGLLLFVVLLAAITPPRVPWWVAVVGLPALFALWANAHASTIAGLGWLAAITLGRAMEWWRSAGDERPAVGRLLLALGLCAGAVCLNPDGPRLFPNAFLVTKSPNLYALPEWRPVDFSKGAGMPWGYFATLAGLLLSQLAGRRAVRPTALIVLLTFGFWPALQQRGLGYWWLIAPWLAVPLVASALSRPAPPGAAGGDVASGPLPGWVRRVGLGLVAAAILTTPLVRWLVLGPRDLGTIVTPDTPVRLARELTAGGDDVGRFDPKLRAVVLTHYPGGRFRGLILTGEEQGDFLAWVFDGDELRPVMVYSRPETFDPDIWGEAEKALDGATDWWEILGRHQANLIAVSPRRHDKLVERLRGSLEWAIVEDRPALVVAVRKVPKLPAELQP